MKRIRIGNLPRKRLNHEPSTNQPLVREDAKYSVDPLDEKNLFGGSGQ